jgi:hypothetical protein
MRPLLFISTAAPGSSLRRMIASVDEVPAPRRIALGSDAYTVMHKQLSERLAALEGQKDVAISTDAIDG